MSRFKVLVIAYACSPTHGSEPGVGWGWVSMIAKQHDVDCIVASRYRDAITAVPQQSRPARATFHFVDHVWSKRLDRWYPPYYLWSYRRWQKQAYRLACTLHRKRRFQLCHLVTYVGFRVPGEFYRLDCPFIWGPIGGLENTAWRFLPLLGIGGALYYAARNLINHFQRRLAMRPRQAMRAAAQSGAVIAATPSIQHLIRRFYGVESAVICEVGPPLERASRASVHLSAEPLKLCWAGEHLPGKALPLLLHALSDSRREWELHVYGDGAYRRRWQLLASQLDMDGRVTWHGNVPRQEVIRGMRASHLMIITSLKDLTSSVLLEALSQALPVICPDHCGFSAVVDDSCGFKIPIANVRHFSRMLRETIDLMAMNEPLRQRLANGALLRAERYSWDTKGARLGRIYQQVLARR